MDYSNTHNFLSVLKALKPSTNPFNTDFSEISTINYLDYNIYGFAEDNYDFDVKCPICFKRVTLARRPENCFHIFCAPCLEKWAEQSYKCPYCRKDFTKILKVSFSEPWVQQQFS